MKTLSRIILGKRWGRYHVDEEQVERPQGERFHRRFSLQTVLMAVVPEVWQCQKVECRAGVTQGRFREATVAFDSGSIWSEVIPTLPA